jgi:hypothetical protein
LKPGKGFCCALKHLPKIIDVLTAALRKARELDLIADDEIEARPKPQPKRIAEDMMSEPMAKFSDLPLDRSAAP